MRVSREHEHDHDSPQGPLDPHGDGGIDAQPPPGGPQRTDSPQQPTPEDPDGAGDD